MKTQCTFVLFGILLFGCQSPRTESISQQTKSDDSIFVNGSPCAITFSGVHFTKAINGADTLVSVETDEKLRFNVGEKKDYFADPNGKLSNNTAPILLTEIDNKKPFTFVSKVTPEFRSTGQYNAGVLFIYGHDALYQKFCYEQDEFGDHRVVTVRTVGTSDDNNHEKIDQPYVYLKISSDGETIGNYYSLDNKNWKLVRLYQNNYPDQLWIGMSAQCPVDTGSMSYFEDIKLEFRSVDNFRLGI